MNVCFLLHFYQPSNQFGDVVKKITGESYIPLIKLLKEDKKTHITANFPLSLLEQLEKYGYKSLLTDIKDLVSQGRIELTGCGAYHPLLTKIPEQLVDQQVILNETGLGYYFGSIKDFEGEDCFMIKNLQGFFPPEMAVNDTMLSQLANLGYNWVVIDEPAMKDHVNDTHKLRTCYTFGTQNLKLIIRNRALTNAVSFKRDLEKESIVNKICSDDLDKVIALDAETFGHHFKEGIYFLESLLSDLHARGIGVTTISETFSNTEGKSIQSIEESTWSTTDYSEPYPLWENPSNPVNSDLWKLFREIHLAYLEQQGDKPFMLESPDCTPAWKQKDAPSDTLLNLLKAEQSDIFWWSTGVTLMGKANYSQYMVSSALDYYSAVSRSLNNKELSDEIENIKEKLPRQ